MLQTSRPVLVPVGTVAVSNHLLPIVFPFLVCFLLSSSSARVEASSKPNITTPKTFSASFACRRKELYPFLPNFLPLNFHKRSFTIFQPSTTPSKSNCEAARCPLRDLLLSWPILAFIWTPCIRNNKNTVIVHFAKLVDNERKQLKYKQYPPKPASKHIVNPAYSE